MGNCQNQTAMDRQVAKPIKFSGLKFTCKAWIKTYNNLYDFTAPPESLQVSTIEIRQSTRIVKTDKQYRIIKIGKIIHNKNDLAIDIIDEGNNNYLFKPMIDAQDEKIHAPIWLVVKSLPSMKYTIKEGDMIRMGKQKVRIKQIILKDKEDEKQQDTIQTSFKIYENLTKQKSIGIDRPSQNSTEEAICRVCLEEGQKNNPLIAPCKCTGSAKFIHLTCIQQWLTKSINPHQVSKATVITWKPLICQLCSTSLPFKIYLDGKRYFTVKIPRPKRPYLVLNPIYKNAKENIKVYLLVSFAEKNKMIIGRRKDSDIVISDDPSVSRHHTILTFVEGKPNTKYAKGKFMIEDNNSRYGTLALLKQNLPLKSYLSGISFQFGGDLVQVDFGMKTTVKAQNLDDLDINQIIQSSQSQQIDQEAPQDIENQQRQANNDIVDIQ